MSSQKKLIKLARSLNYAGYTNEGWEVAKVVVLQEIHFKQNEDGSPVYGKDGKPMVWTMESTLGDTSLDLAAKYICAGKSPQEALEAVAEMCGNCFDAEYIRHFEFGNEIGKQEAEEILKQRGEWTDHMTCEFCQGPIIFKQHELDEFEKEDSEGLDDDNC